MLRNKIVFAVKFLEESFGQISITKFQVNSNHEIQILEKHWNFQHFEFGIYL